MENISSKPFSPSVNEFKIKDCIVSLGKKILGVALGALASVAVTFLSLVTGNVQGSLGDGLNASIRVYSFIVNDSNNLNMDISDPRKIRQRPVFDNYYYSFESPLNIINEQTTPKEFFAKCKKQPAYNLKHISNY
jgi:hypothetical protein